MTLMMFSAKCVSAMLGETIALTAIPTGIAEDERSAFNRVFQCLTWSAIVFELVNSDFSAGLHAAIG
jgi:hypothetical protein